MKHRIASGRPVVRGSRVAGFTITEAMMGMFVFAIVATGLTSGVLQSRRLAQLNIMRNTAYTVAQGYLEQMKAISTADLSAAADPSKSNKPPIATKSVSALAVGQIERDDPLYVDNVASPAAGCVLQVRGASSDPANPADVWNYKQIMIDLGADGKPVVMNMWIDVDIWRDWPNTAGAVPVPTMLILLDFEYQCDGYQAAGRQRGSLRTARTELNN
jgi:hypothetical protein